MIATARAIESTTDITERYKIGKILTFTSSIEILRRSGSRMIGIIRYKILLNCSFDITKKPPKSIVVR
jgi:hypothetical protein